MITPQLDLLSELLRSKAPSVSDALRPGLEAGQISRLLAPIGHGVPGDLIQLYRWHDGCEVVDGAERAQIFPGAQMLPLDEAMTHRDNGLDAEAGWKPGWLPIFAGYESTYWAIDCSFPDPPVIRFDWLDLPEIWRAYDNIRGMLAAVIACWSRDAYREGPHASVEEDPRAVAAIQRGLDVSAAPDIDGLVRGLASTDDHVYSQSLGWLRTRLYPEAVPALIRAVDTETRGRMAAVELLGAIGGPNAIAKLSDLADRDQDANVRAYARRLLTEQS